MTVDIRSIQHTPISDTIYRNTKNEAEGATTVNSDHIKLTGLQNITAYPTIKYKRKKDNFWGFNERHHALCNYTVSRKEKGTIL